MGLCKHKHFWYTVGDNNAFAPGCGILGVKVQGGGVMDLVFSGVLYEELHTGLVQLVNLAVVLLEFIGVGVIVAAALMGIVNYVRRDPLTRLKLAKGMAMGLEFKLGSEILRTVVVREFTEIAIVGAIIVLRAALTFLIHWEIKTEEAQMEQELEKRQAEVQKADSAKNG